MIKEFPYEFTNDDIKELTYFNRSGLTYGDAT